MPISAFTVRDISLEKSHIKHASVALLQSASSYKHSSASLFARASLCVDMASSSKAAAAKAVQAVVPAAGGDPAQRAAATDWMTSLKQYISGSVISLMNLARNAHETIRGFTQLYNGGECDFGELCGVAGGFLQKMEQDGELKWPLLQNCVAALGDQKQVFTDLFYEHRPYEVWIVSDSWLCFAKRAQGPCFWNYVAAVPAHLGKLCHRRQIWHPGRWEAAGADCPAQETLRRRSYLPR
jgi:hypothetical protein